MEEDRPTKAQRDRLRSVPGASSPQLLTHLLEMVARGVRSTRALQEALGVEARTVQYYVQAAAWLGFLEESPDPCLSPDGLAYVYAGPDRLARYARAVQEQPFVRRLLDRTRGRAPTAADVATAIAEVDPDLSQSTIERRASAIRGLLAPYLDHQDPSDDDVVEPQLQLPLAQAPTVATLPPLADAAGQAFSPDIYRYILCVLLDHGELTLGHVRGLLDHAGATQVPIGAYVDLAMARGDAVRMDERLVAAEGAVHRRDLASSTMAVIVSDTGWREHIEGVIAARDAPTGSRVLASGRYRPWTRRLLGHELAPDTLERDLARVLRDRGLASWPRTVGTAPMPTIANAPFLDSWQEAGLVIALPPSLVQLWEGVAGVNRRLRNARHRADAVGAPTLAYRPVAVHAGILHPGEPLPRTVPDARSLRQRIIANAPYVCLTTALLHAHRARDARVELVLEDGAWMLKRGRQRLGRALDVLDRFAADRAWLTCRRPSGGVTDQVFVSLLERLGIAVLAGGRLVLDDVLFAQLRSDDEAALLKGLGPLSEALVDFTDRLGNGR